MWLRVPRRDLLPMAFTVVALLLWSTYAYLTIRIDGDMVAEAIQVQHWLQSPFWVLSYPGQLHGGILEYPLIMVAETLSPGNVYGWTLIRVLYVPVVGLLMCQVFRLTFPGRSLWSFALAAAAGPAVLHSMLMIKDLYALSWLLAAAGVYLAYRQFAGGTRPGLLILGGFLVGLGVYEHATSALFSIPLLAAAAVRWVVPGRHWVRLAIGIGLGLVPLAMALTLQPGKHVVYSPAHASLPDVGGALGVSAAPTAWAQAIIPNGWGFQHTDLNTLALPPVPQLALNSWLAGLLVIAIVIAVPALVGALRGRSQSPLAFVAVMWGTAVLVVIGLITVVRPVFFYGTPLAFLVWMTVGALPFMFRRWVGITAAAIIIGLMAMNSAGSVLAGQPRFLEAAHFKLWKAKEIKEVADAIADTGVQYIYGDYWEVLPIAYASAGRLYPLTPIDSRFAIPDNARAQGAIVVAVPSGYTALPIGLDRWGMAGEALATMSADCQPVSELAAAMPEGVQAFRCPVTVFEAGPGE